MLRSIFGLMRYLSLRGKGDKATRFTLIGTAGSGIPPCNFREVAYSLRSPKARAYHLPCQFRMNTGIRLLITRS
jgi:hypothetical protein